MLEKTRFTFYNQWAYPGLVALIQIFIVFLVAYLFANNFSPHNLKWFWSWDSNWYLRIVRHGYVITDPNKIFQATAFFPLYPLLILFLSKLTTLSINACSLMISNVAFWFAIIYVYRFTLNEYSEVVAKYTIWLIAAFPTALFFHCAYTESLNLLFLVLFFYFLQQKHWYRAMIAGLLASITHGFGLILIFSALAYLLMTRQNLNTKTIIIRLFSLLIIPAGIFAYMIYLYFLLGTPFAFIYAHKYWHHVSNIPVFHNIYFLIQLYSLKRSHYPFRVYSGIWNFKIIETVNAIFPLILVLMGVLMLTLYRKMFSLPIKIFYIITLLLSISSSSGGRVDSFARYVLVLFPGFIVWAYCSRRKEIIFLASFFLMFPLKIILLGMFVNGYWVT